MNVAQSRRSCALSDKECGNRGNADEGVARVRDLTKSIGADSALECVGTQESMMQAIKSTRPDGEGGITS